MWPALVFEYKFMYSFLFVQSSMFLDEQLGLLSSVAPFSPLLYILNLAMWVLGFNTFVRTQDNSRIPRVAARNHGLLFIYLERSSDDVEAERKCTLYVCVWWAQGRNQVMQRIHGTAHDNIGCTANRLFNIARQPNRITNLVGLNDVCLAHPQPHTRCHVMERRQ